MAVHEALAASDVATPCPKQAAMAEAEGPLLSAMDAMAAMAHKPRERRFDREPLP